MNPSNLSPETAPVGTTLVKVDGRGKIRARFVVAKWTPTGQLVSECGTRFRPCSRDFYDRSLQILTPEIEQVDAALRARGRAVREIAAAAEKIHEIPSRAFRMEAHEVFSGVPETALSEARDLLRRAAELLGVA